MQRSHQKELLDQKDIPFADIRQNMRELDFINTYLGGHQITIKGFRNLLGARKRVTVCEIGCGGGDNLMAIYSWCTTHDIAVKLIGIDYNPDCTAIAAARLPAHISTVMTCDYASAAFADDKPDIIFSSLFCHHFEEADLRYMLGWMQQQAKVGFFINDLHRHILAFYSIKILTRVFSKSYLVRNDAPLSVKRGLLRGEWKQLLDDAGIKPYTIAWKWAFRWLIVSSKFPTQPS